MHPSTFYDKVTEVHKISFTEYATQKKAKGNYLLREAQFDLAVKGKDRSMLIWLGKQRLGQREPEPPQREPQTQGIFNQIIDEMKKESQDRSKVIVANKIEASANA